MNQQDTKRMAAPKNYAELLANDSREVPEILTRRGDIDIGPLEVPTRWYLDPEVQKLEMERIWKRSWQMVCRQEDIPEVGDTWVYDIGSLSFVIVRTAQGEVRAFYNSCLHRGRPLRDCPGRTSQLKCAFHGFTWSLDGALLGVPNRDEFPMIDNESFRLPEAKVGSWGGFIFINPDLAAESLEKYLGILPEAFARSPLENKVKVLHISKVLPANWKVVNDAFLEAFHVLTTHPQWTVGYSDHLHRYDAFGNASRIIIPAAVPSHQLRWTPSGQDIFNCMVGAWDDAPIPIDLPAGDNIRQSIADTFREQARQSIGDKVELFSDAEMLDVFQYNLFPNFGPFFGPTVSLVYKFKPYGDDPLKSVLEVMMLAPRTDEVVPWVQERRLSDDENFHDVRELDFFGAILNQDTSNLDYIMRGIANNQRGKLILASYQELKLRHFYKLYAEKMGFEI